MNGAGEALGLYRGNGSVSGECENRRMQSGRNGTLGRIRRETGLKPLNGFRLKGMLIYSPRRLIGKSGMQEGARFPQQIPDFPLSRFKKNGEGPINQHSLKAVLRRDGSPAQASPSESRLQPEASEGLQARDRWDGTGTRG